jgi:hypothetical protein
MPHTGQSPASCTGEGDVFGAVKPTVTLVTTGVDAGVTNEEPKLDEVEVLTDAEDDCAPNNAVVEELVEPAEEEVPNTLKENAVPVLALTGALLVVPKPKLGVAVELLLEEEEEEKDEVEEAELDEAAGTAVKEKPPKEEVVAGALLALNGLLKLEEVAPKLAPAGAPNGLLMAGSFAALPAGALSESSSPPSVASPSSSAWQSE